MTYLCLGIRGEINVLVKVDLFNDLNRFRQSSCGVKFFCSKYLDHLLPLPPVLLYFILSDNFLPPLATLLHSLFSLYFYLSLRIFSHILFFSNLHSPMLPGRYDSWLCGRACGEWGSRVPVDWPYKNPSCIQRGPTETHLSHVRYMCRNGIQERQRYM